MYRRVTPIAFAVSLAAASLSGCLKPTPEQRFDAGVLAPTSEGEAFRQFKKDFPEDFAQLRAQMSGPDAANLTDEQLGQRAGLALRAFVARNAVHTAAAPDAELVALGQRNRDFIKALQRSNPALCAKFGMRGLDPGDTLDAQANEAASKVFLVQLRATSAGKARPTPHADISNADGARLAAAIKANGVDDRLLNIIAGGMNTASPADQCAGSVAMYEAVAGLPAPESARWTSFILKQAAQSMR